jgi:hypothetical protein
MLSACEQQHGSTRSTTDSQEVALVKEKEDKKVSKATDKEESRT